MWTPLVSSTLPVVVEIQKATLLVRAAFIAVLPLTACCEDTCAVIALCEPLLALRDATHTQAWMS